LQRYNSFSSAFPSVTNYIGDLGFGLSGGGELIRLFDAESTLIDSVDYDDDDPWPPEPDGDGPTLELINPTNDNSLVGSWQTSVDHGTPGTANHTGTLDIPTSLIIVVNEHNMDLNWTAVDGATGYNIYRSTNPYTFGTTRL